jgi:hypothetical protein
MNGKQETNIEFGRKSLFLNVRTYVDLISGKEVWSGEQNLEQSEPTDFCSYKDTL